MEYFYNQCIEISSLNIFTVVMSCRTIFPDDIDDIPVLFLRVLQKCNVERGDVKKGAAKSEVDE